MSNYYCEKCHKPARDSQLVLAYTKLVCHECASIIISVLMDEVKLLQKETEVPKIATFEVRYKCDNGKTEHIRFFESLHFAQEYMDWLENQGIEFLSLQFYLLIESRVFLIK